MIVRIEETPTTVEIDDDREQTLVKVERDQCWQFTVENLSARLTQTDTDRQCPDWLERLLFDLGVEEVVA